MDAEEYVCTYLKEKGYEILDRNYYGKRGEIDIIIREKDTIIFVEVKYRKNDSYGRGYEFVDNKKQKKIYYTALDYITKKNLNDYNFRFDVISITNKELEWIKNSFRGDEIGF